MALLNRETLPQSQVGGGAGGGGGQIHTNPSEELAGTPGDNKMGPVGYGIIGASIGIIIVCTIAAYYIVGWCQRRSHSALERSGDSGIELQIQNPAFNHSTATTLNAKGTGTPNAKDNFPEETESTVTLLPEAPGALGLPTPPPARHPSERLPSVVSTPAIPPPPRSVPAWAIPPPPRSVPARRG